MSTGQTSNAAKFGRALTKSVLDIGFSNISTPVGRGKLDQSSPKLRKTDYEAIPSIVPNFIAFSQTMYEKRVTIFYLLVNFGAPGSPRAKVHQSICTILSCSGNLCARHVLPIFLDFENRSCDLVHITHQNLTQQKRNNTKQNGINQ